MQPTRSLLRWTDDLHKIFVEAVAHLGGPYEAKPTAVKQTMEAMGVTGLTIWNIKSHLQRYREKCDLRAESPRGILGAASPSNAGHDLYGSLMTSETEMVMGNDSVMNMTRMEMVNYLLMDDTEVHSCKLIDVKDVMTAYYLCGLLQMVDNDFSADEVQMMENELMSEIEDHRVLEKKSSYPADQAGLTVSADKQ